MKMLILAMTGERLQITLEPQGLSGRVPHQLSCPLEVDVGNHVDDMLAKKNFGGMSMIYEIHFGVWSTHWPTLQLFVALELIWRMASCLKRIFSHV